MFIPQGDPHKSPIKVDGGKLKGGGSFLSCDSKSVESIDMNYSTCMYAYTYMSRITLTDLLTHVCFHTHTHKYYISISIQQTHNIACLHTHTHTHTCTHKHTHTHNTRTHNTQHTLKHSNTTHTSNTRYVRNNHSKTELGSHHHAEKLQPQE